MKNKKNTLALKKLPKRKYVKRKYAKRKGGNNPPIPQQQPGVIGTALNDLKNNKEMFQPVYDTASNIGLFYDFGKALMSTILAGLGIFVGIQIKNYYSEYTEKINAKIVTADCYYTDNKKKDKKCDATIEYEVEGKKYKNNYVSIGTVNLDENVEIYYDPKNPNNFTTIYNLLYYIGWGVIILGILSSLVAWGVFIMSLLFKPVAAASGAVAIGDVLTPNNYSGNVGNFSSGIGNFNGVGDYTNSLGDISNTYTTHN